MATERRAIIESSGPSHFVVHFDKDDCIATIPKKSVTTPDKPSVGDVCTIRWSDGVDYTGTVLAMGDAATAKKAEQDLWGKENAEPAPKKRKGQVSKKPPSTCKSGSRKRKPLKKIQAKNSTPNSSKPDFELGFPAAGLIPPPEATVSLPLKVSGACDSTNEEKVISEDKESSPAEVHISLSNSFHDVEVISDDKESCLAEVHISLSNSLEVISEDDESSPAYKHMSLSNSSSSHDKECSCHGDILGRLEKLESAVHVIDRRLLTVLSHLIDMKSLFVPPPVLTPASKLQPPPPALLQSSTPVSRVPPPAPVTPIRLPPPPALLQSSTPVSHTLPPAPVTPIRLPPPPALLQSSTPVSHTLPPAPVTPTQLVLTPDKLPLSPPVNQPATPAVSKPPSTEYLHIDAAMMIKNSSSSRMNFAANVNRRIFTIEERVANNVRGKLGKGLLDPDRMEYIKDMTFKLFPLEGKETEKAAWNGCATAIDEVNRRLNKSKK